MLAEHYFEWWDTSLNYETKLLVVLPIMNIVDLMFMALWIPTVILGFMFEVPFMDVEIIANTLL